jgi:hypothetical protein
MYLEDTTKKGKYQRVTKDVVADSATIATITNTCGTYP